MTCCIRRRRVVDLLAWYGCVHGACTGNQYMLQSRNESDLTEGSPETRSHTHIQLYCSGTMLRTTSSDPAYVARSVPTMPVSLLLARLVFQLLEAATSSYSVEDDAAAVVA